MTDAYKAPPSGEFAWWKLTPKQKRVLQEQRLTSAYGGETAAGVGRAPYFWGQEYGNPRAGIQATGNATRAWHNFIAKAKDVARSVARSQ